MLTDTWKSATKFSHTDENFAIKASEIREFLETIDEQRKRIKELEGDLSSVTNSYEELRMRVVEGVIDD